jgi:DNA-binding LacI/PurR family transcriptional regulator
MGRIACHMLLDLMNPGKKVEADIMLAPKLLERESVTTALQK